MGDQINRTLPPDPAGWEEIPLAHWWNLGRKLLRLLGIALITSAAIILVTLLYLKSRPLPPPPIGITTQLVDREGDVLDQLDAGEHRDLVHLGKLPRSLVNATLAAEDQHFFEHRGFSLRGIFRATLVNLKEGRVAQGASTITQQLARNLYLTHDRTWSRKWKEAILTTQLELHFTKPSILEMYLNKIYYGHGAYGVERASHLYFHKPAQSLTLAESAMLAGIPRGPGYYSPLSNPVRAKKRQELILDRMVSTGAITRQQATQAKQASLTYGPPPQPTPARAPWFRDYVIHSAIKEYGLSESQVRSGGLKIFTTLDSRRQHAAEKAFARYIPRGMEGALVSMDPKTGAILAMVGGSDYHQSQFNRVFAHRQPGSTFKPLLYLAALEQGYTPLTRFNSQPTAFQFNGETYAPTNYHNHYFHRPITMLEAIAASDNIYAVHTLLETDAQQTTSLGRRMGIQSPLQAVPSLALGTSPVQPMEMAKVYATLANSGVQNAPYGIDHIIDAEGRTIGRHIHRATPIIPKAESFVMTQLLKKVFEPGGTAHSVQRMIARPVFGKTGSTEWDSWLSGYTPELETTLWLGYDRGKRIPAGTSRITHSLWGSYMKEALAHTPVTHFSPPKGVTSAIVDPMTGSLASSACPQREKVWFLQGSEPTQLCSAHTPSGSSREKIHSLWERIKKWWNG
ncbi:transglycosylase domain-containing protein [Marininema halotolerans]|uniref:Penicillin-binding protein, 1A family n=1 Tax=Marininema halotolerans TaxID=1155944 RepID=A0A1I6P8N9_9BACL|nr:PBP1A family penicillin-binding protein [Marininema halotolerans]SFS36468.1 penicillin-binding protein, 1A family [Marininema halotolerans]